MCVAQTEAGTKFCFKMQKIRWRGWPSWTRSWPRAWVCITLPPRSILILQVSRTGDVSELLMTLVKMMVMVTNVLMSLLRVNSTPVPLLLPLQLPALPQLGLHPRLDLLVHHLAHLVHHLVHLGPAQLHGAVGDPEPQPAATQLQPLKRRRKICDTIKEEKAHSKDSLGWKGTQSQPIPCPVKYMWGRFSSSFAKSSSTQVNPTNMEQFCLPDG